MNRIDHLIAELCPGGVEVRTLESLGTLYNGLTGKAKADFANGSARYVSYVNVFTNRETDVESRDFVKVAEGERQNRVRFGDVLFTASSENFEDVGLASAVTVEPREPLYLNSFCFGFRPIDVDGLRPEFAKYLFQSPVIRRQIIKAANGVTRINISKERFRTIEVPVPPPAVQHQIVDVLDAFTDSREQLDAELEAELEARRRQYEHYHDSLLSFAASDWPKVRLADVTELVVGFPFKSSSFSEDTSNPKLVRGDNIGQGALKARAFKHWSRQPGDGLDRYELRLGDVVLAMDRPWIAAGLKWARLEDDHLPALLVQRVARLRGIPNVMSQRFLGWVISAPSFTAHVLSTQTGNTVPHISGDSIGQYEFDLPPIEVQERVAATLDQLDALVSELSSGISVEKLGRGKQYEYYRDKLLTFDDSV